LGATAALLVLILIVLAAVGAIVFALVSKAPSGRGQSLHLPGLSQLRGLVTGAGSCSPGAYPPGAEYTYERCLPSTTPIGWRRCSTVTYSVDSADAPPGYRADLDEATGYLAAATGLHLVEVPRKGNITIAWDPSLFDPQPGTSGEAGVTDFQTSTDLGGTRASAARIRISSHLVAGTAIGRGEEPILLHEFGHAVGLGHFGGPEAMNPLDRGFSSYQRGDLDGLAALYHPASC
jgi:hypothetical protein